MGMQMVKAMFDFDGARRVKGSRHFGGSFEQRRKGCAIGIAEST